MQHALLIDQPISWQLKAESLMDAFEVLIENDEHRAATGQHRRVLSVAYMLAGFAIENLLKGQMVARNGHRDAHGQFKLKTHDLRQLAQEAGYELDEAASRLLERTQEFTVWTARYPAPILSDDMRPRPTPDGGFAPRTYHQGGEDWPALRSILRRFRDDLCSLRA